MVSCWVCRWCDLAGCHPLVESIEKTIHHSFKAGFHALFETFADSFFQDCLAVLLLFLHLDLKCFRGLHFLRKFVDSLLHLIKLGGQGTQRRGLIGCGDCIGTGEQRLILSVPCSIIRWFMLVRRQGGRLSNIIAPRNVDR